MVCTDRRAVKIRRFPNKDYRMRYIDLGEKEKETAVG